MREIFTLGFRFHSHFQGMFTIYGRFFISSVCSAVQCGAEKKMKKSSRFGFDSFVVFGCVGFFFFFSKLDQNYTSSSQFDEFYRISRIFSTVYPNTKIFGTQLKYQLGCVWLMNVGDLELVEAPI